MDTIDFIMAYESGQCTDDQIITGFQALIDNGMAWTLQGHYGTAKDLIDKGYCHMPVSANRRCVTPVVSPN